MGVLAKTDRVDPRQAREFAKSMGVLAKTDRVDARCLRDFADVLTRHKDRHKCITLPADPVREVLTALMTRRRQLVEMRVAESNRLEGATSRTVRSIRSVIKTLDKQLQDIDGDIDRQLEQHFKQQKELLDSVRGVGPLTILTLTSALPELGRLGRRQIAKLVGVAPLADDSGALASRTTAREASPTSFQSLSGMWFIERSSKESSTGAWQVFSLARVAC